ncbi:PLP-dependent aminotransferase family protein [Paraglaciecola sp.]|uniref:MocR-like pyridoxine biosynthesis transcription factor PdxR n=1 Tax=Paraglaciecola sp. TaxID=1920173 RepID=UPI0030F386A8
MDPIFELNICLPQSKGERLQQSIAQQLKTAIADGRLQANLTMPPTRKLAEHLGTSRNTIIAVYTSLTSEGYLHSRLGAGTYVADIHQLQFKKTLQQTLSLTPSVNQHQQKLTSFWRQPSVPNFSANNTKTEFDFSVGKPELGFFPFAIWRKLLAKVSRLQEQGRLSGPIAEGQLSLRRAIAQHISVSRAVACNPDNIVVTAGAQQAFDILARILVTPGQTQVAMECPGYPFARQVFAAAGAKIIDVQVDEQGIMVEHIPVSCRVIYVTPSHQFPTGVKMSAQRRLQLLAFAQHHNASIIEDDYDSEIRFQGSPLDALQTLDRNASVFYVGTFSKCLMPDLRLGFVVVPYWASAAITSAKLYCDWHSPVLLQETLAMFIQQGHLTRHIQKLRKCYRQRLDELHWALDHYLKDKIEAIAISSGAHMTGLITTAHNGQTITNDALQQGVKLYAICDFSNESSTMNGLVFGLGGIDKSHIAEGIYRLSRLMKT